MLYEQKDHKISECQNVVQSALEFMVTLVVDSRFVATVYSYYKMSSSQLTYFFRSVAVLCSYRYVVVYKQ